MRYAYRPGLLSTIMRSMSEVVVRDENEQSVGRIVRGVLPGCERAGTFRYEPETGSPTTLGIGSIRRSWVARLVRPEYRIEHAGEEHRLTDSLGENLLYFSVGGQLRGQRFAARQDWDDSVEVTWDRARIARWQIGTLSGDVRVDVDTDGPAADPGSLLFGVTVLLPFMHMIHSDESELISSVLE